MSLTLHPSHQCSAPLADLAHPPRIAQKTGLADGRTHPAVGERRLQAFKMTIPATERKPRSRIHGGHEWIYVLEAA